MDRLFAILAALGGFLALALGTIAAHLIKGNYPDDQVQAFYTGVDYQFYHVLGLFAVAWACSRKASGLKEASGWSMILGTILFSGSLYGYALTRGAMFGYLAAIGGVVLMVAWLLLAVGFLEIKLRPEVSA